MLRVGISLPFGLGVLLPRVTSPGRATAMGLFCGERCRAAFHGVPCGSSADLRVPRAGMWAAVAGLGVVEEGHSGVVPEAGAS